MNTQQDRRRGAWLRQGALLLLECAVLLGVLLLLRAYVFALYADPQTGQRVVVDKRARDSYQAGDRVVFRQGTTPLLGTVSAVPGDTVEQRGERYLIPIRCACNGTECDDCRYYLVKTAHGQALVNHHHIVGRAHRLF